MPAQLVALNDGPDILVDKPILLIGRHPECDIQIESRKISRRHCCIAQVHDYLVVRDLDSTNGIRINGVRVVEGKLNTGDELTIGNHSYKVTWEDSPPQLLMGQRKGLPSIPQVADDEILESYDEPVPLPDPNRPLSPPISPPPIKPLPPPLKSEEPPFVLPEHLDLIPNSGSYHGPSSR